MKKGLIQIVNEKLKEINSFYSLTFEEIPISTRLSKREVIPKLYSFDRNGYETKIITLNEKRYKLFLHKRNRWIKPLKSGTKESMLKFCECILQGIAQHVLGKTNDLAELFMIDDLD